MAPGIELPDDLVHCLAAEARLTGNLGAGIVLGAARTYGVKDFGFDRRHLVVRWQHEAERGHGSLGPADLRALRLLGLGAGDR